MNRFLDKNARRRPVFSGLALGLFLFAWAGTPAQTLSAAPTENKIDTGIPEDWKVTGSAAASCRLVSVAQKYKNQPALQLKYSFVKGQNDFVFLEKPSVIKGKPKKAKMNLYGDGSGGSVRLNFTDASGETFQAVVAKVEWEGWKEVEADLAFPVHWGGDNNAQMDGEISFYSLVFNTEPGQTRHGGEIAFTGFKIISETAGGAGAAEMSPGGNMRVNVVVIDDFERTNPLSVYQSWRGDDSTIEAVSATEFKKQGNYSTQLTYKLVTTRSVPSWVSLSFLPDRFLDWTGADRMKFWVKGDGTENLLQVSLIDDTDRVYTYKFYGVLKNVDWRQVEVNLGWFQSEKDNTPYFPGKIRKYEFKIVGIESQITSGRVWLDEMTVEGQSLDPLAVSPRPVVSTETLDKTKINWGNLLHLEYRHTPELNSQFLFYNALYLRATSKKISVAADIVSQQAEAGQSTAFRAPLETAAGQKPAPTEIVEKRPPVELAYVNTSIYDLHPNLSQVTVGNITIDYGRDSFSPLVGLKGVQAEGNISPVYYNAFLIKHPFDSITNGFRFQTTQYDTLLKFIMVRHRDTAKTVSTSEIKNGQLVFSNPADVNVKTEPIGNDTVYLFEGSRDFAGKYLNLSAQYGLDFFDRDGLKDVSDPFNPVVKSRLDQPVSVYGSMWQVKLKVLPGIVNKGFTFISTYRDFSSNFKPRFRFSPAYYDDFVTDQKGVNFDLTQIIGHAKVNAQYDDVVRGGSASGYYRRFFQGSIGYYGLNRMDIVFSVNKRREYYALGENFLRSTLFIDPADPRNEETETYELFLGNWFTNSFYIWGKLRLDNIRLRNTGRRTQNDSIQMQAEYAVNNQAKLNFSMTQTRYDDATSEPFGGDPPTDNVVRLFLDINF